MPSCLKIVEMGCICKDAEEVVARQGNQSTVSRVPGLCGGEKEGQRGAGARGRVGAQSLTVV